MGTARAAAATLRNTTVSCSVRWGTRHRLGAVGRDGELCDRGHPSTGRRDAANPGVRASGRARSADGPARLTQARIARVGRGGVEASRPAAR